LIYVQPMSYLFNFYSLLLLLLIIDIKAPRKHHECAQKRKACENLKRLGKRCCCICHVMPHKKMSFHIDLYEMPLTGVTSTERVWIKVFIIFLLFLYFAFTMTKASIAWIWMNTSKYLSCMINRSLWLSEWVAKWFIGKLISGSFTRVFLRNFLAYEISWYDIKAAISTMRFFDFGIYL
jgi:hypothetical protein